MRVERILASSQERTNTGHITGVQIDNVQVAQAGFGEDDTGNNQNGASDQGTDRIGENVLKHDPAVSCTQSPCNQDIFLILKAVELHSGTGCHTCPTGQEERYKQDKHMGDL